jgi:hypothetical protein
MFPLPFFEETAVPPQIRKALSFVAVVVFCLTWPCAAPSQEAPPIVPPPPAPEGPPVPQGIEVLARGPVHEAFATPTTEPRPTPLVSKKPPPPLDEMPPDEKPEGDLLWIGGYWAWDDDRSDFLWVSGCWRQRPPGRDWIAGYWREQREQWQWVPGFWTVAGTITDKSREVTYYPEPPAPPPMAPPGNPPAAESFYIPGHWQWSSGRWSWRSGYWGRMQPGYVWVPAHYRWTPFGYVFIAGYWDLAVPRRGVLYAPVVVDAAFIRPAFVYTPVYAVSDAVVLQALFVRPAVCHYYFGDYYGPRYRTLGFESCFVYSRRHYDPLIVYQRWEYRDNPRWLDVQVNLTLARDAGRAPRPPRTLVQQNNITQQNVTNVINVTSNKTINNNQVLAPTRTVVKARGASTIAVSAEARAQVKETAQAVQQAAVQQRRQVEVSTPKQDLVKPRVAAWQVPPVEAKRGSETPVLPPQVGGNLHRQKAEPGRLSPRVLPGNPMIPPPSQTPAPNAVKPSVPMLRPPVLELPPPKAPSSPQKRKSQNAQPKKPNGKGDPREQREGADEVNRSAGIGNPTLPAAPTIPPAEASRPGPRLEPPTSPRTLPPARSPNSGKAPSRIERKK